MPLHDLTRFSTRNFNYLFVYVCFIRAVYCYRRYNLAKFTSVPPIFRSSQCTLYGIVHIKHPLLL